MSEWISVEDRLPEIDYSKPRFYWHQNIICSDGTHVRQLKYASNAYAKTEKGMEPRFEELSGRLAFMNVTHWTPLPEPPQ